LRKFKIKFNTVKLGISRRYKELIYLDLLEGGDEMRKLFLELEQVLKTRNEGNFTPHLTLGRVSKDLTNQEYSNICRDLQTVSKGLAVEDIEFVVDEIKLIKSIEGNYEVLMSFTDSSSIRL
jgi:2'-5' RNA ligase